MEARKKLVFIDVEKITSRVALHVTLKEALAFPDFYGKNWAAFWDAITGLVELPEKIVFKNWQAFVQNLPEEAEYLKRILADFNHKHPEWKTEVIYN
ncbi:barstar family protein [Candidatus Enterococcus clewellii]|uniref:Barstar (barnase inhibitor) domain-containing protein n=1 Tax=Candidatus Enterococcus clewellii TaxID=1834193 RepID=A0A242KCW7_9ENTE|nr:barstar family protein [Enterococcus sp. 9E7_DIV0242]OTP19013.1 hypothetical protein A5888_000827 [Enterococcus sp. 9E7_DIV0242]